MHFNIKFIPCLFFLLIYTNCIFSQEIVQDAYPLDDNLIIIKTNDKVGLINSDRSTILPAIYDDITNFKNGLARIKLNNQYGFTDKKGKIIIPCIYDNVGHSFENGFVRVKENEKYGVLNSEGKLIVPCIYDWIGGYDFDAEIFIENLAIVSLDGKEGFINNEGKIIIPIKYGKLNNFDKGIAPVMLHNKWYFIDKNNNIVIEVKDSHKLENVENFYENRARIKSYSDEGEFNSKYGFIDKSGNNVIPLVYNMVWYFAGGLSRVTKYDKKQDKTYYGLIDVNGKEIISTRLKYENLIIEDSGEISIYKNKKYGLLDQNGKQILKPIFSKITILGKNRYMLETTVNDSVSSYSIKNENRLIPLKYNLITNFKDNLAIVGLLKNGKEMFGFIDKSFNEIISPMYSRVWEFSNGLAAVEINKKIGFINEKGELIIPPKFDKVINSFRFGYAKITLNDKNYLIDKKGNTFLELKKD